MTLLPEEIRISGEDDALRVTWNDGHRGYHPFGHLRGACPCATCKGNHLKVDIRSIVPKEGVFLVDYEVQGHYALRLLWSDAHQTGIYTYTYLREICKCRQCASS